MPDVHVFLHKTRRTIDTDGGRCVNSLVSDTVPLEK